MKLVSIIGLLIKVVLESSINIFVKPMNMMKLDNLSTVDYTENYEIEIYSGGCNFCEDWDKTRLTIIVSNKLYNYHS